jgi:glycine/D-amino acid oxidase-like deaminating enzyme
VFAPTQALGIEREADGFRVHTDCGCVRAHHVVVATNGYSGSLVPRLPATLVAVESAQVATEPLVAELLGRILPTGSPVCDTRRSLLYFRRSPDGRLVMGGRGGILSPTGEDLYDRLRRATTTLYPELKSVRFTHAWAGKLAVTLDHMPHLHEPELGLIASVGCNGRGVAYSHAIGRVIADRIAQGAWDHLPMPVSPVTPMPLAPFRRLGAATVARWYGWRDRRHGVL